MTNKVEALIGLLALAASPTPQPGTPPAPPSNTPLTIAQLCTTAAIGIAGYFLARSQVKLARIQAENSQFSPKAIAIAQRAEVGHRRYVKIAVRVSNTGGAPGMIRRVDIRHGADFRRRRSCKYVGWGTENPLPFYLPGRASAVIVLEADVERELFRDTDRIVLEYGLDEELTVSIHNYSHIGSITILPPGSVPVSAPPSLGPGPVSDPPPAKPATWLERSLQAVRQWRT